jgi:hypothetical protein
MSTKCLPNVYRKSWIVSELKGGKKRAVAQLGVPSRKGGLKAAIHCLHRENMA